MTEDISPDIYNRSSNEKIHDGKEISVDKNLFTSLLERVKQGEKKQREFFVYLLGKEDIATIAVNVGIGYQTGISFTPSQAVEDISPYINEGYKIIADLHNHPDIGIYESVGYPLEAVTTPSVNDFDSPAYTEVPQQLGQDPYPRIIVAYNQEKDTFAINAYLQNRDLTAEETELWSAPDPNYVEEEPDDLGIVMLPNRCLSPEKLVENNVITLIHIKTVLANEVESIKNCLEGIKAPSN